MLMAMALPLKRDWEKDLEGKAARPPTRRHQVCLRMGPNPENPSGWFVSAKFVSAKLSTPGQSVQSCRVPR